MASLSKNEFSSARLEGESSDFFIEDSEKS
jgi:hypothetical protein